MASSMFLGRILDPRGYGRREEYERDRGPRGRGKSQFADVPEI
jgi:hypothetical protein